NEGLGADQFNESLHKFLGRSELTLRFSPFKKGYEILRNDSIPVEVNLSEGEKTAIAFIYFITKLKENDNKMENTIVVVDDPVSSFD
uniref:AAA family ATPase n=1 Tax=Salmonella sp. ZJHZ20_0162 TaxID=3159595 RepID=UPI00397D76FB